MRKKIKDNIVRIGSSDKTEIYEHAILTRMAPRMYNDFGCIIIQCIGSRLEFAEIIIERFKYAGLQELKREKKDLKTIPREGESYILKDAFEITLKKIPVLDMMSED